MQQGSQEAWGLENRKDSEPLSSSTAKLFHEATVLQGWRREFCSPLTLDRQVETREMQESRLQTAEHRDPKSQFFHPKCRQSQGTAKHRRVPTRETERGAEPALVFLFAFI